MMNFTKYICVSLLAVILSACGGSNTAKEGLFGKVTMEGYEGKQVYLETTVGTPTKVDSALVENGKFALTFTDATPQVYRLVLGKSADDMYPITLPVVSEKGHISVVMGELVLTSGTPLNDNLQDFLLAVSNFTDKAMKQEKLDMNQIKADYAKLVEGAVMQNIKTPVGAYIYRMYSDQLSDEQQALIMSRADESFKEAVK